MPDFLLALHYLCCMIAILILRAILYIMSCFSARKTSLPCGTMPAVCSPCPADAAAQCAHTHCPLEVTAAHGHGHKPADTEVCLECNVLLQFWPAVWLGWKSFFIYIFIFIYNDCPYFALRQVLQILHSSFDFQYWFFLQQTHMVSGSWPQLLFLKTLSCKDCNFCHRAFPDAAGHSHDWNKRNPIVTRGKLTYCHPP